MSPIDDPTTTPPAAPADPGAQQPVADPTQPAVASPPGAGAGDPAAATPTATDPTGAAATDTATAPASQVNPTVTGDTTATAPSTPPAPQVDAPTAAPSSVAVGDVVRLAPDEDYPDAPASHVLVVGTVEGTEHRPEGALVVGLPDARWVPLDALATDD